MKKKNLISTWIIFAIIIMMIDENYMIMFYFIDNTIYMIVILDVIDTFLLNSHQMKNRELFIIHMIEVMLRVSQNRLRRVSILA
jgi:hypothetical protein